jgi:hypothetical protein
MVSTLLYIFTYVISVYHHWRCELESHSFEVYSIQHYVIKFVSELQQVGSFLQVKIWFPPPRKLTVTIYNWKIVESGIKHHNPNLLTIFRVKNVESV